MLCSAGARGRHRRDLPSSRTTEGHPAAERRQTQTASGKLISRGSQRPAKPPGFRLQRDKAVQTEQQCSAAARPAALPPTLTPRAPSQLLSEGFACTPSSKTHEYVGICPYYSVLFEVPGSLQVKGRHAQQQEPGTGPRSSPRSPLASGK